MQSREYHRAKETELEWLKKEKRMRKEDADSLSHSAHLQQKDAKATRAGRDPTFSVWDRGEDLTPSSNEVCEVDFFGEILTDPGRVYPVTAGPGLALGLDERAPIVAVNNTPTLLSDGRCRSSPGVTENGQTR